jgi:hypothetical protein
MSDSTSRTAFVRSAVIAIGFAMLGTAVSSQVARAQSEADLAAAAAISMTPFGRVTTVNHAAMGQGGRALGASYSSQSSDPRINGYAGLLNWGGLQFQVAATKMADVNTAWSGSATYGRRLIGGPIGIGLEVGGGYGTVSEAGETVSAIVGGARLPVAMSFGAGPVRVAPYAAPGFFYGRLTALGASENGTRPTVNAGVRTMLHMVAIDLGMQRTFIEDAENVFGAGLSLSF